MDSSCRSRRRTSRATAASPAWPAKSGVSTGPLEYVECVADQLTSKHDGKTYTSLFPKLAKVKSGEVVVFSWIIYKSKADQKRVMKKVMEDPRLAKMMDPANMPFDMSRMAWAGFKPIVEA